VPHKIPSVSGLKCESSGINVFFWPLGISSIVGKLCAACGEANDGDLGSKNIYRK
jgi:hypothetical protein